MCIFCFPLDNLTCSPVLAVNPAKIALSHATGLGSAEDKKLKQFKAHDKAGFLREAWFAPAYYIVRTPGAGSIKETGLFARHRILSRPGSRDIYFGLA